MNKKLITYAGICMAGFLLILGLVFSGSAEIIDDPVRNAVYGVRGELMTAIMKAVTYMGNWQSITLLCIILIIIKPTRITYGIPVAAGAIGVTVLNNILKVLVERPRPEIGYFLIEQGGWSFPSGHSITSMFVFGMLILLIRTNKENRKHVNLLTVLLSFPMILIGVSRVYLGVHYPTDVLAGWFLGILMILIIYSAANRLLLCHRRCSCCKQTEG